MDCVRKTLLVSTLFALAFLRESEGTSTDGSRVVDEGAPGGCALQEVANRMSLLQKETRQEWQEALQLLEQKVQEQASRRDEEIKVREQSLEIRIKDLEMQMSALRREKLECSGGRDTGSQDRLLSRLEDLVKMVLQRISPAESPATPASPTAPSTPHSANASSATPASSPSSSPMPSTNTTAFPTLAPGSSSTPAPSPSAAPEPQPSAARAAPPTADPARRDALRDELFYAARKLGEESVERILDRGADPNYAQNDGVTALMEASLRAEAPVVSLLLRWGADVRAANFFGETALHFAAARRRYGGCAGSRNSEGTTPWDFNAESKRVATVRALLAAGASKALKDNDGRTPLGRACSDAVRALLHP